MCSGVCGTVHYKKPLKTFDRVEYSRDFWASFCRDIAIFVQKAKQSNIHTADIIHLSGLRFILGLQQSETLQRRPCGIAPGARLTD